jgi:hypothetical protein
MLKVECSFGQARTKAMVPGALSLGTLAANQKAMEGSNYAI